MCISKQTRKEYQEYIDDCNRKIVMTSDILEAIEKFKHRKVVNKTFFDILNKAFDITVYVNKEYTPKIRFNKYFTEIHKHTELYLYCSEGITWETLEQRLKATDWLKHRDEVQTKLDNFDAEVDKLIKLKAYIKELDIKNYSLYRLESDLQDAINEGGKL